MKLKLNLTILLIFCSYFSFAQTWQWGRQTVSTLTNSLCSDVDNKGNIWISGNYGNGTINFSGNILPAPPLNFSANIFIANYDINGNLLLAKHFTGSLGDVNTYGLKIDNVNNIYVSGNFLGSLYLDSDTLITGGSPSSFVFKADSLGNVIWAKKLSYIYSSTPSFIDLDSLNNIVIVGSYQYSGGGGLTNVFIEKLDSAGNSLFQTIITGQNNNMTWNPLFIGTNGSYYVTGLFEGSATLNATTITPVGGADIFVAKFSSNDSLHWFKNYGSFNNDNAGSIISDENGSIYFTSQTAQKAILNKLTSAGDSIWNQIVGNPNNNNFFATDLIYKNHKIIVTGGYFNNNILIGNIAFPFTSHTNLYLAQVDSNGIYDWGIVGECTGSISPFSMRFSNDNIYINGNFGGLTGPVSLSIANDTLISNNAAEAEGFLVKLNSPNTGLSHNENIFSGVIASPNPNNGNFTISFSNFVRKGVVEIYNVFGEKVFEEYINTAITKEINLKNISAGIYFVKVFDGNNIYCKKLIVERN